MPRQYLSDRHLWSVASSDAGSIALKPNRADDIHYDVAWSSSMPANLPTGGNGSTVLDIGRGVSIRATGNVKRGDDGQWRVQHFSAKQYPTGRDLTIAQANRAVELIGRMIGEWASTHAGDIAQADDIDRNNGARHLEEAIERHDAALAILRVQLRACDEGEPFTQFPELPTDGRR